MKLEILQKTKDIIQILWFGWGYATIKIFTHKIKGLVESDFILASKIDKIEF